MTRLLALALVISLTNGCALWRRSTAVFSVKNPEEAARPDVTRGLTVVESDELAGFFEHAHGFYTRLALRRFNDRNTFMDPKLAAYFRTESAYADYYANMTGALRYAHFKRLRPLSVEILEVRSEGPGKAVVVTRMVGDNSRPLRWTDVELTREDKWERVGERWWIAPGRI
ncbi:MAG TPA: hypothetical protein VFT98_19795 [Myxococcota bacterium]|nr:hypothetical protein [Myxococcota bacterium]